MPDPIPAEAAPLTCQTCRNSEATQVFVVDGLLVGRSVGLMCAACGDQQEPYARRIAHVWRFRLAPLQEVRHA